MTSLVKINGTEIVTKEYKGQRVLTLTEIDKAHSRPTETAGRNFRINKCRLQEGVDYFSIFRPDFQPDEIRRLGIGSPHGGYLVTLSGYLMLVKSFTDDLAWKVQRELVNGYFQVSAMEKAPKKPKAKTLLELREMSTALKALYDLMGQYGDEKYLYPLRNAAFIIASNLSFSVFDIGDIQTYPSKAV